MGTLFSRTTDEPPFVEKEKILDERFKVGRTIGHNEFYKVKLADGCPHAGNEGHQAGPAAPHQG